MLNYTDKITKLDLTKRTVNALRRAGINTVQQFVNLDDKYAKTINTLGATGLIEIAREKQIVNRYFDIYHVYFPNCSAFDTKHIKIRNMGLTQRTTNSLTKHGLDTFADLLALSNEELMKIRGTGSVSIKEINLKKQEISLNEDYFLQQQRNNCKQFVFRQSNKYAIIDICVSLKAPSYKCFLDMLDNYEKDLYNIQQQNGVIDNCVIRSFLLKLPCLKQKLEFLVIEELNKSDFGITHKELYTIIAAKIKRKSDATKVINELMAAKLIDFCFDNRLMVKKPTFETEAKKILIEQEFDIIMRRINGQSLKSIANKYKLTKERIRQIEKEAVKRIRNARLSVYEDNFRYLYEKYEINETDFTLVFGEPVIFNYLALKYGKPRKKRANIASMYEDEIVPVILRNKFI